MRDRPSAEVNSVMIKTHPDCWLLIGASTRRRASPLSCPLKTLALRMKRRNTVSVTPAIGARTVAGATNTLPISIEAGTRAISGMLFSRGLSQFFFMETFFIKPYATSPTYLRPTQQRPPSPEAFVPERPTALTSTRELPYRRRTWHTCDGNAPHVLPYPPTSACPRKTDGRQTTF